MQKKNIAICIILSIVTCGIYSIVWFINLVNNLNILSDKKDGQSGGVVFLLTFITCGIYGIIWAYKAGETVDEIKQARNMPASNSAIMYLILYLLTGGLVTYAILQNEINNFIDQK